MGWREGGGWFLRESWGCWVRVGDMNVEDNLDFGVGAV